MSRGRLDDPARVPATGPLRRWVVKVLGALRLLYTPAAIIVAQALIAAPIVAGLTLASRAQLDPGSFEIRQKRRTVGEIFVPARAPGATRYVEHWVLFPEYAYPAPDDPTATRIGVSRRAYASDQDFFARVPWGPGFRYVTIDVAESSTLPDCQP
jgi:hypothetical protein